MARHVFLGLAVVLLMLNVASARPLAPANGTASTAKTAAAPPSRGDGGDSKAGGAYYIFGYGSLLQSESRQRTNCGLHGWSEPQITGLQSLAKYLMVEGLDAALAKCESSGVRPVRVRGVRRAWNTPGTRAKGVSGSAWDASAFGRLPTFLGATSAAKNFSCTGAVYSLSKKEYDATVLREQTAGYLLQAVPLSDIDFLDGQPEPKDAVIAFFASDPNTLATPTPAAPIVQSYVDVFLNGVIELQEKFNLSGPGYEKASSGFTSFAAETLAGTYDWSPHWMNDRVFPLRPWAFNAESGAIDKLLLENIKPEILQKIFFPGQQPQAGGRR